MTKIKPESNNPSNHPSAKLAMELERVAAFLEGIKLANRHPFNADLERILNSATRTIWFSILALNKQAGYIEG